MSRCAYIDCDDGAEVCRVTVHRARVPHKCCECSAEIRPGSMYERAALLYDGMWSTYDTCARCANVWRDYFRGGREFGGLAEWFLGSYGFNYLDGIPPDFAPCKDGAP